jgi:hypothetical protein
MRKKNTADRKREVARNELWPGSAACIWDPTDTESTIGFATMPRLMPWIMVLIRELAGKGINPTGAYLELWCRDWGQGIISITDEQEHAYASGYRGQRGLRTWREHMQKLADLHFIRIVGKGSRAIAHVLLLNPLAVAHWYHTEGLTPPGWWAAFRDRAREIKATIPPPLDPATIGSEPATSASP